MRKELSVTPIFAIVFFCFIQLFASFSNADVPLKLYATVKDDETFKSYIGGVGKGLFCANLYLVIEKKPPIFCPPAKLPLSNEIYLDILDRFIKQNKDKIEQMSFEFPSVEYLLLLGLIDTFP